MLLSVWSGSKVVRGRTCSRLYIAASWRWSLMCEMISLKECLHMIDTRCLADGWVFFCNFMLLSYVLEELLQVVDACLRGGICSNPPWLRMRMITIGSFLSYRDAIQLYEKKLFKILPLLLCVTSNVTTTSSGQPLRQAPPQVLSRCQVVAAEDGDMVTCWGCYKVPACRLTIDSLGS